MPTTAAKPATTAGLRRRPRRTSVISTAPSTNPIPTQIKKLMYTKGMYHTAYTYSQASKAAHNVPKSKKDKAPVTGTLLDGW